MYLGSQNTANVPARNNCHRIRLFCIDYSLGFGTSKLSLRKISIPEIILLFYFHFYSSISFFTQILLNISYNDKLYSLNYSRIENASLSKLTVNVCFI